MISWLFKITQSDTSLFQTGPSSKTRAWMRSLLWKQPSLPFLPSQTRLPTEMMIRSFCTAPSGFCHCHLCQQLPQGKCPR